MRTGGTNVAHREPTDESGHPMQSLEYDRKTVRTTTIAECGHGIVPRRVKDRNEARAQGRYQRSMGQWPGPRPREGQRDVTKRAKPKMTGAIDART